jgi:hypothetical protein
MTRSAFHLPDVLIREVPKRNPVESDHRHRLKSTVSVSARLPDILRAQRRRYCPTAASRRVSREHRGVELVAAVAGTRLVRSPG